MGLMGLIESVNLSTPSTPFGPIDLNGSVQLGLTCTFKSMGFGPVQLDLLTVWLDLGLKSDQAGPLTTLVGLEGFEFEVVGWLVGKCVRW